MIEKIKGIRINGRCFKSDTNLIFYQKPNDRLSIIYGKNGSGKSSISEGIASISQGISSDLSVTLIDSNKDAIPIQNDARIFVFNEKYVDENVKIDDDGLGTIVLLGSQVDLQSEIEAQETTIETISDELDIIGTEYSKYQDKSNPLCPLYHYTRIVTALKQDGGWAAIDSKIRGNKIKSAVTEAVVKEIGEIDVNETPDELKKSFDETQRLLEKVSDSSISYPNKIEKINNDLGFESSVIDILAKRIEKPVLSEREKLIVEAIEKGYQERIESAQKEFSKDDTSICPYCYQPISNQYKHDLIESINKVLNKDVDAHKAEIAAIQFPSLSIDLSSVESLDAELVKNALQQLEHCKKQLEQYQKLAIQKATNVYTPIIIESNGFSKNIEGLNALLGDLETKRNEFNDAAKKKTTLLGKLLSINKAIAHNQIAQLYKDYSKQEKSKAAITHKIDTLQKKLEEEKDKLKRLQQRKEDFGLAIERINNSLDYVFLAQRRLSIELRNGKYYLKSNGVDVLPKKVSQGERNIIALCYFFTQILSNQEIERFYQNESFVVIDDPISSFDFENKIGITSLLRYQADRIIKGNNNSKLLVLSHDLETVFALKKAFEEIHKSTKGIAGTPATSYISLELSKTELVILENHHNEYGSLLKRVYHFANGDDRNESLAVGNEMRRILEAFSTFSFKKGIDKVSYDKNVLSALGNHSMFFEALMYRLVLHGESHYEEQIYSVHDGYNFYQFVSEDEKIKTAKSILSFMYLLNPYHIIAYFQEETGAIENIKQWAESIPNNQEFEIAEKKRGRLIPLYSLPISAGIGNESFDGVPSEDYETDNEKCDFALKITGNSMEPYIPDGSVVLVKKQATIDDKEVGAFFYNGKVYCKYMRHDNNGAFLCSYNESYPPIALSEDDEVHIYGAVVEVEKASS